MTAPMVIYGISNCDTMRKARAWLDGHGLEYRFHDYRREGLAPEMLRGWIDRLGWEALLNRSGTTFRKLPAEARDGLDAGRALALMLAHPAMIRRPVLEAGGTLLVGFRPESYAALL